MFIIKSNKALSITILIVVCIIIFSWVVHFGLSEEEPMDAKGLRIGLIVANAEDEWKTDMYEQINLAAKDEGISLMQIDTERTLSAQIEAMRTLIVYGVDVIMLSPIAENGWSYVAQEAADAGVKIVAINDRMSVLEEVEVYSITYQYQKLAAQMMGSMTRRAAKHDTEERYIIELKGVVGSSITEQISGGIGQGLVENPNYVMNFSIHADYMRSRAKEQINSMLRNNYPIETIVAHNDAMALGVLDALDGSAYEPGKDVEILAFGGGADVMAAFYEGKINYVVKCNVNQMGKEAIEVCKKLIAGEYVERDIYLDAWVFEREAGNHGR